jgi:hypothetical protein
MEEPVGINVKLEEFQIRILSAASLKHAPNGYISFNSRLEAGLMQVDEPHLRQLVLKMWHDKLISLAIFDGQKECTLDHWVACGGTLNSFFHNATDSGHVRVRLLAPGAMLQDGLPNSGSDLAASAAQLNLGG